MSVRPILKLPDPMLRQVSKPVERIDASVLRLLDDMAATMYDAPGIGLAAVQLGVPLRLITIDVNWRRRRETRKDQKTDALDPARDGDAANDKDGEEIVEKSPVFLINPRIVELTGEPSVYEEGCLSIPEYYAEVERPSACKVVHLDRQGKERTIEAAGILSTCLQHEIDHLDGRLFIDYISRLKREMVVKRFTKMSKQDGKKPARMVG